MNIGGHEEEVEENRPMGTAEALVEIMLYKQQENMLESIKILGQTMVQSFEQLANGNPEAASMLGDYKDLLDEMAVTAGEELNTAEVQTMIRDSLLRTIKEVYSPEQIDTLVHFYTQNPWAYESQMAFVMKHAKNSHQLSQVVQQKLMARLPALLRKVGIDMPFGDFDLE